MSAFSFFLNLALGIYKKPLHTVLLLISPGRLCAIFFGLLVGKI